MTYSFETQLKKGDLVVDWYVEQNQKHDAIKTRLFNDKKGFDVVMLREKAISVQVKGVLASKFKTFKNKECFPIETSGSINKKNIGKRKR